MPEKQEKALTPSQKVGVLQEEVDDLKRQIELDQLRQKWRSQIVLPYDNEVDVQVWDQWGKEDEEQSLIADLHFFNVTSETLAKVLHALEDLVENGEADTVKMEMNIKTKHGDY